MSLPILTRLPDPWKQWEGHTVAGTFVLQQLIGSSDQSAVYLTSRGGNKAAIKLVPADLSRSQVLLTRWEEAAKISHPHLVQTFESGQDQLGGTAVCYVVMEYGDEVLSQILPQRALSSDEARQLLSQVAEAIAYLHGRSKVHTRLKPANILAIGENIKVSGDSVRPLGMAADPDSATSIYDAPEGVSPGVSTPADIWSLGVTLVESLTQRPSAWATAARGEGHLREVLPAPFDEIARHCLQADPQRRWGIGEIANALAPVAPQTKPELPPVQRAETPSPKRYLVPILAVLVVAIIAGMMMLRRRPESSTQTATPVQNSAAVPSTVATSPSAQNASPIAAPAPNAPGAVVHQEMPAVSNSARRTIEGTIRVRARVSVNPSGEVTGVNLESPGPSQYFARISTEAARKWTFSPPRENGQNVGSEWTLRFEFRRTQTRVLPTQAKP